VLHAGGTTQSGARCHGYITRWHGNQQVLAAIYQAWQSNFKRARFNKYLNPLTPTVAMGTTAIKHPAPDRVKPSFVIFDIRTL